MSRRALQTLRRQRQLHTALRQRRPFMAAPVAAPPSAPSDDDSDDDQVFVASRSRWALPPPPPPPAADSDGQSLRVCRIASLVPLGADELARIEGCAPAGVSISARALSAEAARALRTRNQPISDDPAVVAAAAAEIDDVLSGAEVWFGAFWDRVPGSMLLGGTRFPAALRWLCVSQAGASQVGKYLTEEGRSLTLGDSDSPLVTNCSGMNSSWIGEWVIGFMTAHCMGLPRFLEQQKACSWTKQPSGSIRGSTVLILGLGAIGEEVARLCRALGARTLATRRSVTIACEFPATTRNSPCDELHPAGSLHALLPRADFVVVATPGTSETAALIGAPELELMRSSAVLINVSRGSTVDWAALSVALRAESGAGIAACYTDVAPTEPLPADDPLWEVPNLVITPHNSGNPDGMAGAGPRYMAQSLRYFRAQLRRYLNGDKVFNVVDNAVGY